MVVSAKTDYFGVGIYSVPDAARLSGLSQPRIRHWMNGYTAKGHEVRSVINRQLPVLDEQTALGFLDLVEIRVIAALLNNGFSLQAIRVAHRNAQQMFGHEHPFAVKKFRTHAKGIFTELDDTLINVRNRQFHFSEVLGPYLKDLDFENDIARRWWPLNTDRRVVIDPAKRFGQPIVSAEGIPTRILFDSYKTEQSVDVVADWYGVSPGSVEAAVAFEERYAA